MNELEGMLSNVLNNPEEMRRLMDMASQIVGKAGSSEARDNEPPPSERKEPAQRGDEEKPADRAAKEAPSGLNEEEGPKYRAEEEGTKDRAPLPSDLSVAALKLLRGLESGPVNNEKLAVLTAMKPFLSLERKAKLERAIQVAGILRMGMGLFELNGGTK
jgi:hypothetical protein